METNEIFATVYAVLIVLCFIGGILEEKGHEAEGHALEAPLVIGSLLGIALAPLWLIGCALYALLK